MTGTEDPVLGGLRAQFEAKAAQVKTIANNPASTKEDLARATALKNECITLKPQIKEREAHVAEQNAIKAQSAEMDRFMREPVRTLPFQGAGGGGEQKGARSSVGGYLETGDSEVDKLAGTGGFKSIGEFAYCQYKMGKDGRGEPWALEKMYKWNELQRKAPSGMFENSDPDGGDLIPREFSNQIYQRMVAKNNILSYLSPITVSGNTLTVPALKEDSRADGSRGGGILGYWDGEANQYTFSKSRYRTVNLRLHKLTVYTAVTDELMQDSPIALQTFLLSKAPDEINFKINDGVINGTGAGMPLGIHNAGSKITVTAVSGQGAGTIVYQNITDMWMRCVAGQRTNAVWLYNQDTESQLVRMYMATGTAAGVALFTPNADNAPGFRLMARPALVMEQCQSVGTAGDLILFAPEGYACIVKGGIESFMSIHLRFDYDETVFKWRFRMDAQPYDNVALTPYKGSNTVSSVVELSSTRT